MDQDQPVLVYRPSFDSGYAVIGTAFVGMSLLMGGLFLKPLAQAPGGIGRALASQHQDAAVAAILILFMGIGLTFSFAAIRAWLRRQRQPESECRITGGIAAIGGSFQAEIDLPAPSPQGPLTARLGCYQVSAYTDSDGDTRTGARILWDATQAFGAVALLPGQARALKVAISVPAAVPPQSWRLELDGQDYHAEFYPVLTASKAVAGEAAVVTKAPAGFREDQVGPDKVYELRQPAQAAKLALLFGYFVPFALAARILFLGHGSPVAAIFVLFASACVLGMVPFLPKRWTLSVGEQELVLKRTWGLTKRWARAHLLRVGLAWSEDASIKGPSLKTVALVSKDGQQQFVGPAFTDQAEAFWVAERLSRSLSLPMQVPVVPRRLFLDRPASGVGIAVPRQTYAPPVLVTVFLWLFSLGVALSLVGEQVSLSDIFSFKARSSRPSGTAGPGQFRVSPPTSQQAVYDGTEFTRGYTLPLPKAQDNPGFADAAGLQSRQPTSVDRLAFFYVHDPLRRQEGITLMLKNLGPEPNNTKNVELRAKLANWLGRVDAQGERERIDRLLKEAEVLLEAHQEMFKKFTPGPDAWRAGQYLDIGYAYGQIDDKASMLRNYQAALLDTPAEAVKPGMQQYVAKLVANAQ